MGKHPVEIVSKSGTAYGTIEIKAKTAQGGGQETQADDTTPTTGESSVYYLWLAVMILAAGVLIFLALRKRITQKRS
ncbi:MAG: LPXTG cell wall anchor domain-containing protein [Clostridiaceae bacterium]|nr:LPXTG cell wall anchor domain-containing protein [Clostridiaceae bacterium]